MSKPDINKENIYRQRLMNAEVSPPPKAWEQIANSMNYADKNRRLIFYRRIIASAAMIIILLSVGIGFLYHKQQTTPANLTKLASDSTVQIIDSGIIVPTPTFRENLAENVPDPEKVVDPMNISTNKSLYAKSDLDDVRKDENQIKISKMTFIAANSIILEFEWSGLLNHPSKGKKQLPIVLEADLNEFLLKNNLIADASRTKNIKNRWSIGGEYSPSYANSSPQRGSGTEAEYDFSNVPGSLPLTNSSEEIVNAYSGGLAVNYILSEKWSIQSGLYYLKQGQEIQNYSVLSNQAAYNNRLSTFTNSGTVEFTSNVLLSRSSPVYQVNVDLNNQISQFNDYLIQQFEFVEIPFIIKYKILNQKIDVYLLGGLNANILVRNNVFIGKGNNQSVGHTNDINSLIYKSSIGISLEYPFSKHFYFNLSPVYKYQLNAINKNNPDAPRTHLIEYKTGISYKF
ncbi:MAG: PorT family protein [Bacteroidetes bacterium]|nr:PorT family protein [Bacteroidota bacterium]